MGVDYQANYGIGYKVTETDSIDEELLECGFDDYLDEEMGDDFDYFQTGYEGDDYYLRSRDPFADGLDLTSTKQKMDDEIKRLKLETLSEFGLIGGMYVC